MHVNQESSSGARHGHAFITLMMAFVAKAQTSREEMQLHAWNSQCLTHKVPTAAAKTHQAFRILFSIIASHHSPSLLFVITLHDSRKERLATDSLLARYFLYPSPCSMP